MTTRILLLATVFFCVAAPAAPAAALCRIHGRGHEKLGNEPSTPIAHTPKKRIVGAQAVAVHSRNRGKYPYVGQRRTPKRTYTM